MLKPFLIGVSLATPWLSAAHADSIAPIAQAAMTHDGKVVSVSEGKLVMADKNGKNEHTHTITGAAKILVNGNTVKLTELKKGDAIKVTLSGEGTVTMVEATRADAPT
jgi:hypothetical protein